MTNSDILLIMECRNIVNGFAVVGVDIARRFLGGSHSKAAQVLGYLS